jgi:hypothetical protein
VKRVIICGGRDYDDVDQMDRIIAEWVCLDDVIVHGNARGADALAKARAMVEGISTEAHPADWKKYGRAAGVIRNQEMLDTGVDLVIAFPGGRGTDDMIKRARAAHIPNIVVI